MESLILRCRRAGGIVLCCTGALAAQNIVPRGMVGVEGGSSTSIPFGLDQPARVLCLYDAEELPWTGPRMINGFNLRADNDLPGTTEFALKQYIVLELRVSSAARRSDNASTTFADNHGIDVTSLMANTRLSFPAQPRLGTAPRPCNIPFQFNRPFFHDLTPVRGRRPPYPGLAIEFLIDLIPAGTYRLDSPVQCNSSISSFGRRGPACVTSRGGAALTITPSNSVRAGDLLTYTVNNMPNNAPFAVAIGATPATGNWVGLPLPISLGVLPNPAPDCWINTELLMLTPGLADQNGAGQIAYQIPPGRQFVGRSFHAQAICRDLAANPLLLVTSLGASVSVCGPLSIARVSTLGSSQATSGSLSYGAGFVLEVN